MEWPKGPYKWVNKETVFVSIPFTWNLPSVKNDLTQGSFFWKNAVVGGPALGLYPRYFNDLDYVKYEKDMPGIMQVINPMATKTTTGCIRNCKFCAVPTVEGYFRELSDWPDLPILCDNNLLACSQPHFDKVIDRLIKWGWCDFNQGVDSRLLTDYHAKRFKEIKKPIIRLALDSMSYLDDWEIAFDILRSAGVVLKSIRSYAIIGFTDTPDEAWERCNYIEKKGINPLPMWYHPLDCFKKNTVTNKQKDLGWTDFERRKIMRWFYKHTETKK